MTNSEPTKRFSARVTDYVKYRPSYPTAVLDCLKAECGLTETAVIADIGSGTGLLTELFLKNGNLVYGVEPNQDMRQAGELFLADYVNFNSVNGMAEATTLPDHSIDFVIAGQAAHWFDPEPAQVEFRRILRPGGVIAFVWNSRAMEATPFMHDYEQILVEYALEDTGKPTRAGGHERDPEQILGNEIVRRSFANHQLVDFAGLQGRTTSSSMMPLPGHPQYAPMMAALEQLFAAHQVDGCVTIHYLTELFYGRNR